MFSFLNNRWKIASLSFLICTSWVVDIRFKHLSRRMFTHLVSETASPVIRLLWQMESHLQLRCTRQTCWSNVLYLKKNKLKKRGGADLFCFLQPPPSPSSPVHPRSPSALLPAPLPPPGYVCCCNVLLWPHCDRTCTRSQLVNHLLLELELHYTISSYTTVNLWRERWYSCYLNENVCVIYVDFTLFRREHEEHMFHKGSESSLYLSLL